MNRTELCARIAARSSLSGPMPPPRSTPSSRPSPTRSKRARPSTSQGSAGSPPATGRRARAAIPAPPKPSPSPPAPCRRSSPARPFATGSTTSRARAVVRWPVPVPQSLLGSTRTSAPRAARRCAGLRLQVGPRRYRRHSRRSHSRSGRTTTIEPTQLHPRHWPNSGRNPSATLVAGTIIDGRSASRLLACVAGTIIDGRSASPWNPPGRRS